MQNSQAPAHTKDAWPALPQLAAWQDTFATLHLWTQVIGKIRLECAPWINHSWGSALYLTPRGLTTSPIPHGTRTFYIDFDFIDHVLHIGTSEGAERSLPLRPMSVAEFYRRVIQTLGELDLDVQIWPMPVEIPDPIQPFPQDEEHASYDPGAAQRFWRALVQASRVFTDFRAASSAR